MAGAYAAAAALAARRRQQADGDGDLIDVAVCDVANLSGGLFADLMHSLMGRPPIDPTLPARSVELPSIEPTLDGWVGFNTNTRVQFDAFCLLIDRPDLMTDEWAGLQNRVARADEWNALVREWTTQRTTAEIVEQAVLLRVPVAPVCDGATVLDLDMVQERAIMVDDPTGTFRMPRRPFLIDDEPPPAAAPCTRARCARRPGCTAARTPSGAEWSQRPATRRAEGRRPHRVVGGADREPRLLDARAPRSCTWSRSSGWTACASPAGCCSGARAGGSARPSSCRPTPTRTTSPSTSTSPSVAISWCS